MRTKKLAIPLCLEGGGRRLFGFLLSLILAVSSLPVLSFVSTEEAVATEVTLTDSLVPDTITLYRESTTDTEHCDDCPHWYNYYDSDGNVAYCDSLSNPGPTSEAEGGVTFDGGWEWADEGVQAIIYNGYPYTTTINNTNFSAERARIITQQAVYVYTEQIGRDGSVTNYNVVYGQQNYNILWYDLSDVEWAAILYLVDGVNNGTLTSPGNVVARYVPVTVSVTHDGNTDDYTSQGMLYCLPVGTIDLEKSSTLPSITSNVSLYSLAGATYGIYSSQSDASSDSNRLATLTTDSSGYASYEYALPEGTYYVKEISAPTGFKLSTNITTVTVSMGQNTTVSVTEEPITITPEFSKVDADSSTVSAQGDATLAGAMFVLNYYAVATEAEAKVATKETATWVLKVDANGIIALDEDHLVTGDPLYFDSNGNAVIPYGVVSWQEMTAPTGYMLDTTIQWAVVDGSTSSVSFTTSDKVIRGGFSIQKYDAELGSTLTQGDANFAGVTISVYNRSASAVYVDGAWKGVGEVVYTATLDSNGSYTSSSDLLPYGTYELRETSGSSDGSYYANEDWSYTFTIREDGVIDEGAIASSNAPHNTVLRGGLSVQKYATEVSTSGSTSANGPYAGADLTSVLGWDDEGNAYTIEDLGVILDNIASVMNVTTYFASVLGTGGSGVSTETATNFYGVPQGGATFEGVEITITNASNNPVVIYDEDGTSKTIDSGGVVMVLTLDADGYAETAADALPYGTYTLTETKVSNKGYSINSTWSATVEIREAGVIVAATDLPEDKKSTSGVDDQVWRRDIEFVKIASDTQNSLSYVPFLLVSNETGEAHVIVTDENGNFYSQSNWNAHTDNTNANDAALTLNEDGSYTVDYTLLNDYAGVWFTGYGPLNDPTGTLAQMVDPNDDLGALPYGTYSLIELSSYGNLGYDGVVITFEITRNTSITADLGTISDNPSSPGNALEISTTALDQETLTHYGSATATDTVSIVDTVSFTSGFTAGLTYTFVGTLMSQTTGEAIVDAEGNEITASTEYTITENDAVNGGSVEVVFEDVPYELVAGQTIVVFEVVYNANGIAFATHEDLGDAAQTVYYPEISTSAVDGVTYEHEGDATSVDTVTIIDTVTYAGLVPGETYTMTGTLYDKETGEAIEGITTSVEFTPEASSGTVQLTFEVAAELVLGRSVVAFEECYYGEQLIAIHADIEDEEQTVTYPEISTTASDASDGDQTVTSSTSSVIVDRVDYVGLTPGVEYTLVGTLYDQESGTAVGGVDPVTLTFTPESSDGYVEMTFTLDTTELVGRTLVVFERLYRDFNGDGILDDMVEVVSTHEDINAESQSVFIADGNVADELVEEELMLAQTGDEQLLVVMSVVLVALMSAAVVTSFGVSRRRSTR